MAFIVDTINSYLNGIVSNAMSTAGGVAGDAVGGVGNSINGVGRSIEGSIRGYGDGFRDYGNAVKDWTGAPGTREATATNPLGLTNSSTSSGTWGKSGGSSIARTVARADAVTKTSGSAKKSLPPARERAKPKALPAPAPARKPANGNANKPSISGPTKTITVGGVTKKLPVYKDGERVGAPSAAQKTGTTPEKKPATGRKGPTKQSIARKERARNAK